MKKACLSLVLATALLAQQAPPATPAPAPPPAAAQKKVRKGGKAKWIVLAAVAAGVTVGLLVLNKRLGNEGHGIF